MWNEWKYIKLSRIEISVIENLCITREKKIIITYSFIYLSYNGVDTALFLLVLRVEAA